ncbi:SMP-30/gluconolactonase/LRE family protein [Flammeovirga aprica]|uniref:SMP-30/gluconolactonase/LRE family protein n=1 Tax=Flammeovirga aprica JL-4 TaxID=694437 RepID=A0A7X9XAM4_9BACT|nr:SMP-30/gluconolactonase/LRE family protein [Flammeovirga aprica]NME69821.1 SMP-30/gluconolactonase/LRE family protein [Flammeovirga aprica JL-4]
MKTTILISLFVLGLAFSNCSIQPNKWTPVASEIEVDGLDTSNYLTHSKQVSLLGFSGAEDFAMDKEGNLYCGTHNSHEDFTGGAILKIDTSLNVEAFIKTEKWVTGMHFNADNELIILMNGVGLLKVNEDKSFDTLLTQTPDGKALLMGSGLDISSEGKIYFNNLSSEMTTSTKTINRLILEMKPDGGVYCFDPKTHKTEIISPGNYFGNGLVLSEDENSILVSETSKYRILRYWVSGKKKGQYEVFMDNLPGFPNNLKRSSNGNYWLGFTTKRSQQLDDIHPKPWMKKMVFAMPDFMKPKADKYAMVMEISESGEILRVFTDQNGEVVKEAGAVLESNGKLYLGGDIVSEVAVFDL